MKDKLNILSEYRVDVSIEFTEIYKSVENMAKKQKSWYQNSKKIV